MPSTSFLTPELQKTVRALIDPGSEITVDARIAALAGWPSDPKLGWSVRTATGAAPLKTTCPQVELIVGDIAARVYVFVQANMSYDIILGQNWRAQMRNELQCNSDGSETTTIRSADGLHVLEIPCVKADDVKNQDRLRVLDIERREAWVEDASAEEDFYDM